MSNKEKKIEKRLQDIKKTIKYSGYIDKYINEYFDKRHILIYNNSLNGVAPFYKYCHEETLFFFYERVLKFNILCIVISYYVDLLDTPYNILANLFLNILFNFICLYIYSEFYIDQDTDSLYLKYKKIASDVDDFQKNLYLKLKEEDKKGRSIERLFGKPLDNENNSHNNEKIDVTEITENDSSGNIKMFIKEKIEMDS